MKLEDEWMLFRQRDIAPDAPIVQLMEMRKAFYAGAASGVKVALQGVLPELDAYAKAAGLRRPSK